MNSTVRLDGQHLQLADYVRVCREACKVELTTEAKEKILVARSVVAEIEASAVPTYGISTGFGELSRVAISKAENLALQRNLILSHACGVGEAFPVEIVRGIMVLRLNTLAGGFSGVSPEVPQILLELLNAEVTPYIPSQGSLGASGDLANLAHMALVMIGEGEAYYKGKLLPGAEALAQAGIKPIVLKGKDGLGIINGTQVMTAIGALAVYDAEHNYLAANMAAALTFEAFCGITAALDSRIHALRPHPGQAEVAAFLLKMLTNSSAVNTRAGDVQDPYTLRCVPQVHGAVKDAITHVRKVIEIEMNAVTDNPLVFPAEKEVISGGNFHGEPLALALDYLAIATAELANISERRSERLVNPQLSGGLPAFLTTKEGVHSGFMIPQYTAASLVSENKVLAHPASVDSIPSSANKEDHVSMGAISARKLRQIVSNTRQVLAIEWMVAAQAVDLRQIAHLGHGTAVMLNLIRAKVPRLEEDRELYRDIASLKSLLDDEQTYAKILATIGLNA